MPLRWNTPGAEQPVLVSVTGQAQQGGEDEKIRLLTMGTVRGGQDHWQLNYTETQPESEEANHVTLSMEGGVVTMQREGEYATSMVFEQGRRFEGSYQTPYGALDMGVFATQVKCHLSDNQGVVKLQYQLDLQGQFAAMHELTISFVPRRSS